jgi:2-dehydro-3-deoxyphosphogluconate aldolase / (4S)-4-hydroxy-2-oxoglutarate aldolase
MHADDPTPPQTPAAGAEHRVLARLAADRALGVVRAPAIADAGDLCRAVAAGGIGLLELTFTTPQLARHLAGAAAVAEELDACVGAGTVLAADDARRALDAGAQFLVTPAITPDAAAIVRAGHDAGAVVFLGALTPSEVYAALAAGADAVKIFPAGVGGPRYLSDLLGPFPDTRLVPSGGVGVETGAAFLAAGAFAVCAGSSVLAAADIAAGNWSRITTNVRTFCAALQAPTA